jgi:hypothetical protein
MDCVSCSKYEGLQEAKTLHIFSKISENSVSVKKNLTFIRRHLQGLRGLNWHCTQVAAEMWMNCRECGTKSGSMMG